MDALFSSGWAPQAFLDFVGDHLPQVALLDLPILTGEELYEAAMAKKSTAGGLDGWAWNEIKALSLSWFVGLALVPRQVEAAGRWPQGLFDAYIAMIPKAEGDSTPLDSAPYVSCRLSIGFGPRFVWPILRNGSFPWSLTLSSVLVKVFPQLMLGIPLPLTLKRFLATLFIMIFISSSQMLSSLLTRWMGTFLTVILGGLVFLPGFVGSTSSFIVMFVFVLNLLLV